MLSEDAGPAYIFRLMLLRIGFTGPHGLPCAGELLPRLSTLAAPERGGISLLHFPWGRPRLPLAVILALRSSDFPRSRSPAPAAVSPARTIILSQFTRAVNTRGARSYMPGGSSCKEQTSNKAQASKATSFRPKTRIFVCATREYAAQKAPCLGTDAILPERTGPSGKNLCVFLL